MYWYSHCLIIGPVLVGAKVGCRAQRIRECLNLLLEIVGGEQGLCAMPLRQILLTPAPVPRPSTNPPPSIVGLIKPTAIILALLKPSVLALLFIIFILSSLAAATRLIMSIALVKHHTIIITGSLGSSRTSNPFRITKRNWTRN